jgi:hypothetical protein
LTKNVFFVYRKWEIKALAQKYYLIKYVEGVSAPGLPDFSRSKHTKTGKNTKLPQLYQIAIKSNKWP